MSIVLGSPTDKVGISINPSKIVFNGEEINEFYCKDNLMFPLNHNIISVYGYKAQPQFGRGFVYNLSTGVGCPALQNVNADTDIADITIDSVGAYEVISNLRQTYDVFYSKLDNSDNASFSSKEMGLTIMSGENIFKTMFSDSNRELVTAISSSFNYVELYSGWDAYGTDYRALLYNKVSGDFSVQSEEYTSNGECISYTCGTTQSYAYAVVDGEFIVIHGTYGGECVVENKRVDAGAELLSVYRGDSYSNVQPNILTIICTKVL